MAQYADLFGIQVQRFQTLSRKAFRRKVSELISLIRRANPRVPIVVQLSTNSPAGWKKGIGKIYQALTPEEMIAHVEAIRDLADGVGFLLFHAEGGLDRFGTFLRRIR